MNPQFGREWEQLLVLAALYGSADVHASEQRDPPPPPLIRARRVLTHQGVHGIARRLKRAGETRTRRAAARVRQYLDARAVHRSEPVRAALRQNRCPDCGGKLDAHKRCAVCCVEFHGLV